MIGHDDCVIPLPSDLYAGFLHPEDAEIGSDDRRELPADEERPLSRDRSGQRIAAVATIATWTTISGVSWDR
jgi:hypothetical protein